MNPFFENAMYYPEESKSSPEVVAATIPVTANGASFSDWDDAKAIKDGFKSSVWVYAANTRIANSVGAVPWVTEQVTPQADDSADVTEEWVESPATALLRNPNPMMDGNEFHRRCSSHLGLTGNAVILKVRGPVEINGQRQRALAELWPVDPSRVEVKHSKTGEGLIDRYMITGPNGRKIPWKPEDVIHIMLVDPSDPTWGMSPLQAASRVVDTDVEAVTWNMLGLQNRSVPDGVFTFNTALTPEQFEEARQRVREQYMGSGNARAPWVMGAGADWKPMSLNPAEMDFIESRKLNREEILAVYQVPPPLVGLYDQATLANIETARTIFWRDTIVPFLDVFRAAYNRHIIPEFGWDAGTTKIVYDTSTIDAFQESMPAKMEAATAMFKVGVPMSQINQRLQLGLEAWMGWDISYLPTSVVPAGILSLTDENLDGVQ